MLGRGKRDVGREGSGVVGKWEEGKRGEGWIWVDGNRSGNVLVRGCPLDRGGGGKCGG